MKTLREATQDAQRIYFQEVLSQVPGTHIERSKAMGISVASYYRYLERLFPNLGPLLHKADYVLGSDSIKLPEPKPEPPQTFGRPPFTPRPASRPEPLESVAALNAERRELRQELRPPPLDKSSLTEDDVFPGAVCLVRLSKNCAVVTDVDWANREVDFTVGAMNKRQTVEDFLKHHIKAMV